MWVSGFLLVGMASLPADVVEPALAYVGPGTGLAILGAALAFVVSLVLGLVGFIWYPVKRVYRSIVGRGDASSGAPPE